MVRSISPAFAQQPAAVDADGTIHVPALLLPESALLDHETRASLVPARSYEKVEASAERSCASDKGATPQARRVIRSCVAEVFYRSSFYRDIRRRYPVYVTARTIGGVYTEVFEPKEGIAEKNKDRVLINLHGGVFLIGSRTFSHLESIPIASVGRIKVISIDYRMAPEYVFPAASEDVAAVYRELLKRYEPGNIGIYGSSAGGLLTAESVAWFQKEGLPSPAAVGMLAGGAAYFAEGDSAHLAYAIAGLPAQPWPTTPYFRDTDWANPLAFPAQSRKELAKFPPSLLVSSTRDVALSSVVSTHSRLVQLGVQAELHVWEGLGHEFYMDPEIPESRDLYGVFVKFFESSLGR